MMSEINYSKTQITKNIETHGLKYSNLEQKSPLIHATDPLNNLAGL